MALAAGLKCDPDLIFEYVYDNIEYEPLFGSNKGALGTLLDQRGNDIDQVNLFAALLTAAGFQSSQINYQYGYIRVTGATGPGWLTVRNDAAAIGQLLVNGGIPIGTVNTNLDGTLGYVDVAHVWAQVQINGINYVFDPSFKQHAVTTGLSNLASALGYTQSQFLSDAGGTVTSTSFSGINRGAVRADLVRYANNLAAYIKAHGPSWSVADLVGGAKIQYLAGSPLRQTALPYLSPSQPSGFPQNWGASVPSSYRACFTISMPGVTPTSCSSLSTQTIQLYADQTYGHRITVFSVPNGTSYVPTLLIDGAAPPNGQNTGTVQPLGGTWSIGVNITHPYANQPQANESGTLTMSAGGSYLLGAGWGQVGRGMVARHRTLLAQARASGASGASEPVLGETLAVISYSWLAENASVQRLLGAANKTTTQYHHGIGIAAQTSVQGQASIQGPYVDLPFNYLGITPQSLSSGARLPPLTVATFAAASGVSSALESAVLEQTQGLVPGMTAASTIRLVDQNVAAGGTTYFADGATATGLDAYFSSIRPNLASYSSADLSAIDHAISSNGTSSGSPTGKQVLLPANGAQGVGAWTGAGYSVLIFGRESFAIAQKISGGLSGGFPGTNVPTTVPSGSINPTVSSSTQATTAPPADTPSVSAAAAAQPHQFSNGLISEPVDAITGAYLYSNTDLVLGNGALPYALPFGRTYSSASNLSDVGLGNGWNHTFSFSASRISDPYAALGEGPATATTAAVAALYVAQDLLSQPLTVQNLTLAWLTSRWLTDQLTNNAVLVSQPDTSEEFIALPRSDGASTVAYSPPLGSAAAVTGSSPDSYGNPTVFTYVTKDQRRLAFNPIDPTNTGSIASFALPSGASLGFTYGYGYNGLSYLTQVSNTLGRSLSLSWSGNHLTGVSDGTGRSVSYGYDGSGNLVALTDPLGNVTRYGYDAASRLTRIVYPARPGSAFLTNSYDGIGRINGQASAAGNSTTFYFAGTRTEMVDPAGDRHVTYQTASGKVLRDVAVLGAAFGTVFNDTPQQTGLAVAASEYDGQDRLVLAISPEGMRTAYAYSPDFRQNVVQRTVTPKPGSPLSPVTTTYGYDPTYNKPTSVTDPLGLVTAMLYDPATGNLLQQVQDAGAAPHLNATRRFTYDARGLLLSASDPLGVVTRYAYDGSGNLTTTTRDAGGLNVVERRGYDAVGNLLALTDPKGATTASTYDANRQLLSVAAPAAAGSPALVTTTSYDPNGSPTQVQQSAAGGGTVLRATSRTYTSTGRVATATDANGNVTRYAYDVADRLSGVTDPVGRSTAYAYDALGRQVSVLNPAVQAAPLLRTQYTPDGQVASLADANGNVLGFAYDGFDRLSVTTYPGTASVGTTTETLAYDAGGNVRTRVTRKGDTIAYGYDTLNRLTSKTAPAGTPSVSYAYDLAGRLTGVTDNGPSLAVATPATSFAVTAAYDALNRPLSMTWSPVAAQAPPAAAATVTFAHRYDASNRRIGLTASDAGWIAYSGPASTTAYAVNALNQYVQVGAVTPTYDANGNLTFDGSFTYGYDAEGRLTSITQGGAPVASYAYDGRGRRKSRTAGGSTTVYVTGAEDQEVLEYDGATGAPRAVYAVNLGGGIDDVLSRATLGGARQTLVPDIQGSIVASLDSGGGTGALTRIGYGAFGESATAVASGGAGPRYTARRLDPETAATGGGGAQPSGLYYYRARIYSPVWGRFLQPDPIGPAGGINLYAYVGNDPLNATDPSGLVLDAVGSAASGAYDLLLRKPVEDIQRIGSDFVADPVDTARRLGPTFGGVGAAAGRLPGLLSGVVGGTRLLSQGQSDAAERAAEIHAALDPIAQSRRTTAVLDTSEGRIIAGGARDLTPAQREALIPGEIAARLPGKHAEITALEAARQIGAAPQTLATTRVICPECTRAIEAAGGRVTSPTTAVFPP